MKYFTLLLVMISSVNSLYPQWQLQNSGTSENLSDVQILDYTFPNSAVVVGDNGTILKTTNNGNTWNSKSSGTTNHLNAVSFCFGGDGIAVGNEVICLTTDGGDSWYASYINKNAVSVYYYLSVYFGWNIIIGCDDGTIFFSSDAGMTWQDTLLVNEFVIATGCVEYFPLVNEKALFATISYNAVTSLPIFQSSPWDIYNNPISLGNNLIGGELSYDYQYLIGTAGSPGSNLLLMNKFKLDTVWIPIYSSVTEQFTPEDIAIYYDYNLFICGNNGNIFTSIDDGSSWSEQITGINSTLNSIEFGYNDSVGYSVGDNGIILFTSNGGGISNVDELKQPAQVHLYQNYPNPFNPTTNIRFRIAERGIVSLRVFDIMGREIAWLVNEEKPAGEYSVEFIPNGIASGLYFYQLNTGRFTQTKKMLLIR